MKDKPKSAGKTICYGIRRIGNKNPLPITAWSTLAKAKKDRSWFLSRSEFELIKIAVEPVIEAEDQSPDESTCLLCEQQPQRAIHSCPYRADVLNDPDTLCNCCSDCTQQCGEDI